MSATPRKSFTAAARSIAADWALPPAGSSLAKSPRLAPPPSPMLPPSLTLSPPEIDSHHEGQHEHIPEIIPEIVLESAEEVSETTNQATSNLTDNNQSTPNQQPTADRSDKKNNRSEIAILVTDANVPISTQSLPVHTLATRSLAAAVRAIPHVNRAASAQPTNESDDYDSSGSDRSASNRPRSRRKFKQSSTTLASPDSSEHLAHRLSTSNLSVVSIATSIQNYRRKRHGDKDFDKNSYMSVYGDSESFELRRAFILELTRSLGEYGAPSHRLEFHLEAVSQSLGINSQVFVMPNLILITFESKSGESVTSFVKLAMGYNMSKLSQVNDLCFDLVHGSLAIEQAKELLNEIRNSKSAPSWTAFLIYPVYSFVLCVLCFRGSWIDGAISAIMSLFVAGLVFIASYISSMGYLIEFTSGFFVMVATKLLIYAVSSSMPCLSLQKTVFSGICMLLPGLALTTSIIEISTRNIVSGTVRLFSALFTAALLGFGYTIGDSLTANVPVPLNADPIACQYASVNLYWSFLLFPPLCFVNCMLFYARRNQYPIMSIAQTLGFVIPILLSQVPGFERPEATTAIAAFSVGLLSNIYSRITRDVAIAPILGGIVLLVPGSFGLRVTIGLISKNMEAGTEFAYQMLMIGICITIGLFLATLFVWPIRGPRTKYITI